MGKVSRKKPPRPLSKREGTPSLDLGKLFESHRADAEVGLVQACAALRSLFIQFAAEDVIVAINVSELWPANVSAQVKHQLAFAVCLSIQPNEFSLTRLQSYEKFELFINALIEILPQFPSLEDYWPESDWGDVKFTDTIDARPSFHGGSVQRISDFIEAFQILHGNTGDAVEDMRHARRVQATLLEQVPRPAGTRPEDASTGHIELPPEDFWKSLKSALSVDALSEVTAGLVTSLGVPTKWRGAQDFGDAVMSGAVIPWLGVQLGGKVFPLSLRNGPAVVLDFWAHAKVQVADATKRFSAFMAKRIQDGAFLPGPLHVICRRGRSTHPVAAVLPNGDRNYLIVFCGIDEVPNIDKPIAEMMRLVRENSDWGFVPPGSLEGVQMRRRDGKLLTIDSLEVIVVVGFVTTKMMPLRVPRKKDYKIVSIVDAVTLFDAMRDVDELTSFWKYETGLRAMGGGRMSDLADLFGSFRDSHGQIIDGAIVPNMIMLDPHWGANWRYAQLRDYWVGAPSNFPDDESAWDTKESRGPNSLRRVMARNAPRLAWSGRLGLCTLHFVLDVNLVGLEVQNGRVLETFTHCAADCLAERELLATSMLALPYRRVVVDCVTRPDSLATLGAGEIQVAAAEALVLEWHVLKDRPSEELRGRLVVNLARVQSRLQEVEDASFEAECATALIDILVQHVRGQPLDAAERTAIAETGSRRPRFVMRSFQRTVDVPDFAEPDEPTPENYKVARRRLAELFMAQGVAPGRYELGQAKTLIITARNAYRDMVHERLSAVDRESLLRYCARQIDVASAEYDRQVLRHQQSLSHEVEYDREQSQADSYQKFTRNTRNFRYAIEAGLFLTQPRPATAQPSDLLEIIGMVDWLLVLYEASDVLHNEIEVGGIVLDHQYVPEVFYSDKGDAQKDAFSLEMASLRLGKDVADEDKLEPPFADDNSLAALDAAWLADLGFRYRDLLKVLSTLINWVGVGGATELAFGYEASAMSIAKAGVAAHEEFDESAALLAIKFLQLDPEGIRRLADRAEEAEDVPVWEHMKRLNRYTIKPLIRLTDGQLLWGASMASRARRIWTGSISAGYLPADFPWPEVRKVVAKAKRDLEGGLEDVAHAVCARTTSFVVKGLDFKYRFPKQGFEDVGDFDVLAYWPTGNRWLLGECKYNQPPFCIKDTRRLRDRIFGGGSEVGQFVKIERRRKFFLENINLIRQLLGWPDPTTTAPEVTEIYLCKDLHWWLRFPPYAVPTRFSQIDTFGAWLSSNGFSR